MQSLEASKNYKNSFVCAAKIFKDEGVLTFWSGAMPRLARLIMSGGIVFTMCVHALIFLTGVIGD
jgi:solute carrier family 25 citrate transporter 1